MQSGWEYLASNHISEIKTCCTAVADALEAAAGVIVAAKATAIGELIGMAIALFADEAAAAVTFDLSELALPAIELPGGTMSFGHHTIYPKQPMSVDTFVNKVKALPWTNKDENSTVYNKPGKKK